MENILIGKAALNLVYSRNKAVSTATNIDNMNMENNLLLRFLSSKQLTFSAYRITTIICLLSFFIFSGIKGSYAQTVILDPNGEGGFENGATFPLNGWTTATSATNSWYVGTFTKTAGTNGAYIGTANTNNNYTATSSATNHFYRNVTFPAGATNVVLSFKFKVYGENCGASCGDWMEVRLIPTTTTPAAGSLVTTGTRLGGIPLRMFRTGYQTFSMILTGVAGTTQRLLFTWTNDASAGGNPAASVDEVSIVANASSPLTLTINGGQWVAPTGVSSVSAECWGAGGAGGGAGSSLDGGGGAGGAYALSSAVSVTPGNSYPVTVGASGLEVNNGINGTAGGNSWFSNTGSQPANNTQGALAMGGGGGRNGNSSGTGGTPTAGSIGTVTRNGGAGANAPSGNSGGGGGSAGTSSNGTAASGVTGGAAVAGGGSGGDGVNLNNGNNGNTPGGGGSGSFNGYSGPGGFGQVTLTWISCTAPSAISAGASGAACPGGNINLTSTVPASGTTPFSWTWSGPNGFTSTAQNPSISNAQAVNAGTYTVTVNNACGSVTATTTVGLGTIPTATISPTSVPIICYGSSVTLTAGGGTVSTWKLNGQNLGIATPTLSVTGNSPLQPGEYSVVVTSGGCSSESQQVSVSLKSDGAKKAITASSAPVAALSGGATFCNGYGSATLSINVSNDNGGPYSGTLQPGNIPFSGAGSPISVVVTPGVTTTYSISVFNDGQCSAIPANISGNATVTVNQLPAAPVITQGASVAVCDGSMQTISSSTGGTLSWSTGIIGSSISVGTPGAYSVTTTDGNGCTSAPSSITVSMSPKPTAVIEGINEYCQGSNTTLSATNSKPGSGSITFYKWYMDGNVIPGASGPAFNTYITTDQTLGTHQYTVEVTNSANCVSSSTCP